MNAYRRTALHILTLATLLCSPLMFMSCGAITGTPSTGASAFLGATDTTTDYTGYIVISESTNRTVMLFDTAMNFVKFLYVGPSGVVGDLPFGVAMFDINNIMILIDGNDRVLKQNIAAPVGLGTVLVSDTTNLVTATRGNITRVLSGDILIVENTGGTIERFTDGGVRNTSGWPVTGLTGASGIDKITAGVATGGSVHCGITADQARTLGGTGATLATAVTLAAHDFLDCVAHTDGRIAVALSGATDRVRIYTDYLMTTSCDYISATLLVNPLTLDFRPNGNVLVWDGTNRTMLEINSSCVLVNSFSASSLTAVTVTDMIVVQ